MGSDSVILVPGVSVSVRVYMRLFAGNQQAAAAPSSARAEVPSPESDREGNQSPSIEDGNETANTFQGDPPGEQTKTSIVNDDAEN